MNRAEKAKIIDGLKERADKASIAIVTDFHGLKVAELTPLRAKLHEVGCDYQVVKNTRHGKLSWKDRMWYSMTI